MLIVKHCNSERAGFPMNPGFIFPAKTSKNTATKNGEIKIIIIN